MKRLAVFLFLSFILVALMGRDSSPLTIGYGMDNAVFRVIGNAWLNGAVPFRDLFDNKGPLHFFIQMLGSMLDRGKMGIYIIESMFLWFSVILLYRIGEVVVPSKPNRIYLSLGLTLLTFASLVLWGNTCEEYSLPFVLYPLLVAVRYFFRGVRISWKEVFFCGVCFACVSQIRLNNTAIIVGLCLALIYDYVKTKKYTELGEMVCMFVLGSAVVLIPIIIYFAWNNALDDMIYTSIIYNMKYKAAWRVVHDLKGHTMICLRLFSCILLPLIAYYNDRRDHTNMFPMCFAISLITFLTFCTGAGFAHYYIMQLPIFFLCVAMVSFSKRIYNVLLIALLFLPIRRITINIYESIETTLIYHIDDKCRLSDKQNDSWADNDFIRSEVFKVIPESERNSIYMNGSMCIPVIFVGTPYYPVGKFFSQQLWIARMDKRVSNDIWESFVKANPKWIVSFCPLETSKFWKGRLSKYHVVKQFNVKHLKETVYIYHKSK
jgi:hypothetical protein